MGRSKENIRTNKKNKNARAAMEYANIFFNISITSSSKISKLETINHIATAENISYYNTDLDSKLVFAEATMIRGLMQFGTGAFIKAAYNVRRSWGLFLALEKEVRESHNTELFDIWAYCVSIFYFAISFMPGFALTFLQWIGFVANRDLAIQYLTGVANGGGIRSQLSVLFLALHYILAPKAFVNMEDNFKTYHPIAYNFLNRYPKGCIALLVAALYEQKSCQIDLAIKHLNEAIESCKCLENYPTMIGFLLANNYEAIFDWKNASELYEHLTKQPEFESRGSCAVEAAHCYYMLGNNEKCTEIMSKVSSLAMLSNGYEKLAEKRANQFKQKGMRLGAFKYFYLRRDPHVLNSSHKDIADRYETVIDELYTKLGGTVTADDEVEYQLFKGAIARAMGNLEKAKGHFQRVIDLEKQIKDESWAVPYALQEQGEVYYAEGKKAEAEKFITRASKYSGFDFNELLMLRISGSLDHLKKEKLTPK